MENNNEVKIAIIVGAIMLTICLVVFIFNKAEKQEVTNLDIKVYKLYELNAEEEEYEYRECSVATDDLITINKEFKKIYNLSAEKKATGKTIKGNYKIISQNDFIAFDAGEENLVYRSDLPAIFQYDTSLYELVKNICG